MTEKSSSHKQSQDESERFQEEHSQRLEKWRNRLEKFCKQTEILDQHMRKSDDIIDLVKRKQQLKDFGYEGPINKFTVYGSISNGNTPYCKLSIYNLVSTRASRRATLIVREYLFPKSMSERMKASLIEGVRLFNYFAQFKDAHYPRVLGLFGNDMILYAVHELFPVSSISHKLWNNEVKHKQALDWILQLVNALETINITGVAHRFIRPENILLTADNRVIVTGFDLACRYWDTSAQQIILMPSGLPEEIPVELWDHLPPECFNQRHNPVLVDSWSVGVLLCILLCDSHPFDIKQPSSMIQQWKLSTERARLPLWNNDDPMRSLLDDIFKHADDRITFFDLASDQRLCNAFSTTSQTINTYYRIDVVSK